MTERDIEAFWNSVDEAASNAPDHPYSHAKVKELLRVAWKQKQIITDQRSIIDGLVKTLDHLANAALAAAEKRK